MVDDGSNDGTARTAAEFARQHPGVRVLSNPGNRGKGYSVRSGMLEAKGQWRLFTDADLSAPIEELARLEQAIARSAASIAIGSRALDPSLIEVHQPAFRETAGKLFNVAMQMALGLRLQDTQCGFKLFSAEAAKTAFTRQQLDGFGFDAEVLFIAKLHGFGIEEVPVRWRHAEGTKVSVWNGARSFLDLVAIRANQITRKYR